MKLTKTFVVSSVLGFGLLMGCGGTEAAEPVEADAQQSMEQPACAPLTGATAVSAGLTCSHYNFPFTHYRPDGSGCYLYNCTGSSWQYKRINLNNAGCKDVEAYYCS